MKTPFQSLFVIRFLNPVLTGVPPMGREGHEHPKVHIELSTNSLTNQSWDWSRVKHVTQDFRRIRPTRNVRHELTGCIGIEKFPHLRRDLFYNGFFCGKQHSSLLACSDVMWPFYSGIFRYQLCSVLDWRMFCCMM